MVTKTETPKPPTVIGATVVQFQRGTSAGSPREWGIAVLRDPGVSDIYTIIDMAGKAVPQDGIWDYGRVTWRGTIVLDITSEVE